MWAVKFMLMSVFLYLLTGCAGSSYDIKVVGSENSNQAYIKFSDQCSYKIDNVNAYENNHETNNLISNAEKIKIFSESTCSPIYFLKYTITSSNAQFVSSALDDMLSNRRFDCTVQSKINNVSFLQCGDYYKIVSSTQKNMGYDNKVYLNIPEKCFYKLKDFLYNCQSGHNNQNISVGTQQIGTNDEVLKKLERLQNMYKDGLINKREYDLFKTRLLKKLN